MKNLQGFKKLGVATLLTVSASIVFAVSDGGSSDGGGRGHASKFAGIARNAVSKLEMICKGNQAPECRYLPKLQQKLKTVAVSAQPIVIGPDGKARDAINNKVSSITVSMTEMDNTPDGPSSAERWVRTAIHEYATIAGFDSSDNFRASDPILVLIKNSGFDMKSIAGNIGREASGLKGIPMTILKEAFANGSFYPKLTSTPWVLIKKTDSLQALKTQLLAEVAMLYPRATITASRIETLELSEWDQTKHETIHQNKTTTADVSAKKFILTYENRQIKSLTNQDYTAVVESSGSSYYVTRFVIEFVDISETEILKVQAKLAYDFSEKTQEARVAFDRGLRLGERYYLTDHTRDPLLLMRNIAVDAIYSAKQNGLSSMQAEEIISNYLSRLRFVEHVYKNSTASYKEQYYSAELFSLLNDLPLN